MLEREEERKKERERESLEVLVTWQLFYADQWSSLDYVMWRRQTEREKGSEKKRERGRIEKEANYIIA